MVTNLEATPPGKGLWSQKRIVRQTKKLSTIIGNTVRFFFAPDVFFSTDEECDAVYFS